MRSHLRALAVFRIASCGWSLVSQTVSHGTPASCAVFADELQIGLGARFGFLLDPLFGDGIERAFVGNQQVVVGYDVYPREPRLVQLGEFYRRAHRALGEL